MTQPAIAPSLPASAPRPNRCASALALFAGAWVALAGVAFAAGTAGAGESPAAATPPDGSEAAAAPAAPAASKPSAPRSTRSASTLRVFNRPIIAFRTPLLAVSPPDRAASANARITALLERGGEGRVTVEKQALGNVIKVDGGLAFVVGEGDVDPLSDETLATLTETAVDALKLAIAETREARDGRLMLGAALWAGGATIAYLVLVAILRFASGAVLRRVLRLADAAAEKVKVGGTELLSRHRALRIARHAVQLGFWAVLLLLTYEWVGFVLGRFPFTRAWGEQLNAFLVGTVVALLEAVAASVPELLIVVVIVMLARFASGMMDTFFDGVQQHRIHVGWLDADLARPTRRLATMGLWIFTVAMAYPYIPGSGTDAFKGLSVLLGVMVSIGASSVIGQAASGLILMYTRTYRPGEYVRLGEHEGTVILMGLFTTRIRTGLGEELSVPNTLALSTVSKNYSRAVEGSGFVLDATVTIGYDAPWRQVQAMLIEAARRTPGVLSTPAPRVFQIALSDFYVEYRLVCQAKPSDPRPRAEVLSALLASVQDVFNEYGVQIMSPHYLGDPADPKVVPRARWHDAPAEPPA